jgi:hypothetical protein
VLLLDDLLASAAVRLEWIAFAPMRSDRVLLGGALSDARQAADRVLFAQRASVLEPVDLRAWASRRGVREARFPSEQAVAKSPPGGESLREADVVLDLTGGEAVAATRGASPAVWRLRGVAVDGNDLAQDTLAARAVLNGWATVDFELHLPTDGLAGSDALTVGICPVHPSSPLLTNAYLAASARQLIVRRLESAASAGRGGHDVRTGTAGVSAVSGWRTASPSASVEPPACDGAVASALSGARLLARTAARQLRKMLWEPQWFLLVGRQPSSRVLPDPRHLRAIFPPPGTYWADPHVVEYAGRVHVFFEEFIYAEQKGRISTLTLDSTDRPSPSSVALETDSHLSYPDVFVHNGRLFMIPEGASSGRVDLYECGGDSSAWSFCRTLLPDTPLVDASIVEWNGRWWLFGSLKKPAGLRTAELLLLFSADDPVTGSWREHRQSPLLADVTDARPAGAPWRGGSSLYRLAQDGARGYGSGIVVNEVSRLDEAGYEERRVAMLRPTWARGLCGVHTLNRAGDVVVMDACRWVRRDPRRPRTDEMLG